MDIDIYLNQFFPIQKLYNKLNKCGKNDSKFSEDSIGTSLVLPPHTPPKKKKLFNQKKFSTTNARHPDVQGKPATDRDLTETPSPRICSPSLRGSTVSFHSRFRSSVLTNKPLPELPSLRSSPQKPAGFAGLSGVVWNQPGQFAACFATASRRRRRRCFALRV